MSLHEATENAHAPTLTIRGRSRLRRPPRVLIVDDLAENHLIVRLYCDQFGFLHESVASGYEAVEAARSGRFDVILMDILMPRMDGFAATQAIRALPEPIASVPIIAVTTAAAPGEVLRYLACGMTGVVAKPITISRLAEAISAALAPARREKSSDLEPEFS
jgi:CheY-like chemotaxis protein